MNLTKELIKKIREDEAAIRSDAGMRNIDIISIIEKGLVEIRGFTKDGSLNYRITELGEYTENFMVMFLKGGM